MTTFADELKQLIQQHREWPGDTALEEIVDALESEAAVLVEEVNARAA
jgi:hypothetical protein